MRTHATLAALAAAVLVVACGGGDDAQTPPPPPPPTSSVPPSASASVDGFIAYLKLLVVAAADMLEPVDTSTVTGSTDETSEPKQVD
jgi:hypothetical protein